MKFFASLATAVSVLPIVWATDYYKQPTVIEVKVDFKGKHVFEPHYVNAEKGDIIKFIFGPNTHTVSQSSFDSPCHPLKGGFVSSSYTPHPETMTVTDGLARWFFGGHAEDCAAGLVFAVNPGDKFHEFEGKAKKSGKDSSYHPPTYEPTYETKPEYKPEYKPEEKHDDYKHEYKPEYKPEEYKPEHKPEYTPEYKPEEKHDDYKPEYKPEEKHDDYKPEYKPQYARRSAKWARLA